MEHLISKYESDTLQFLAKVDDLNKTNHDLEKQLVDCKSHLNQAVRLLEKAKSIFCQNSDVFAEATASGWFIKFNGLELNTEFIEPIDPSDCRQCANKKCKIVPANGKCQYEPRYVLKSAS